MEVSQEELIYNPVNAALRYLGAWTTTDGNTDWGLELLKIKLTDRLACIQKLPVHALQKVTLIKGKLLSVWNYTAGLQDIDRLNNRIMGQFAYTRQ